MSSHSKAYAAKYRIEHREDIRRNHLAWRQRNRETHNARGAQWKQNNKEAMAENNRNYAIKNRQAIRDRAKIYRESMTPEQRERRKLQNKLAKRKLILREPERIRAMQREARQRYKINSPNKNKIRKKTGQVVRDRRTKQLRDGTVTTELLRRLLADATHCPYCATSLECVAKHFDHKQPLVLGGLHSASNLTVCCGSCNIRKGSLPYDVWIQKLADGVNKS